MKLVSWNVNGLGKRVEKGFKQVLADFDADIVCLQETKLQQDGFEYYFPGYEAFWNCAEGKGQHGTAVLTKIHPVSVRFGIGVDKIDKEGRLVIAEFQSYYVICYYSPLYKNGEKDIWLLCQDCVRQYASELVKSKPVIMCGDFNVTHQSVDSFADDGGMGCSDVERGKFSQLTEVGFIDTYRYLHPNTVAYSWWSNTRSGVNFKELNHGNRLDYFLVSEELKDSIQAAEIYADKVKADHCPIGLVINIPQK